MANSPSLAFLHPELKTRSQRGIFQYAKSLAAASRDAGRRVHLVTDSIPTGGHAVTLAQVQSDIEHPPAGRVRSLQTLPAWARLQWRGVTPMSHWPVPEGLDLSDRLSLLRSIAAVVNVPSFYDLCRLSGSKSGFPPVNIDFLEAYGSHAMTTCPMAIQSRSGRVRVVQTVHDLIALNTDAHSVNVSKYMRKLNACVEHADAILAVSDHTRREFIERFPQARERVHVVLQPIPADDATLALSAAATVQSEVLGRWGLEPGQYLLFVGAIEERKNVARLIRAHRQSRWARDLPLVFAGAVESPLERSVGEFGESFKPPSPGEIPSGTLRYLGRISEIDKLCLIRQARLFVFPSLNEGFGIPVLEAQSLGCPVLTSNVAAIPEVVGTSAALLEDPTDEAEILQQIDALLSDDAALGALRLAGLTNSQRFSKSAFASSLGAILGGSLQR